MFVCTVYPFLQLACNKVHFLSNRTNGLQQNLHTHTWSNSLKSCTNAQKLCQAHIKHHKMSQLESSRICIKLRALAVINGYNLESMQPKTVMMQERERDRDAIRFQIKALNDMNRHRSKPKGQMFSNLCQSDFILYWKQWRKAQNHLFWILVFQVDEKHLEKKQTLYLVKVQL